MKKKLLIGFAVLTLGLVAAFNINLNTQKSELSALSLANVEALANGESGGGSYANSVHYPKPGDANYGSVKCVCHGQGNVYCC